MQYKEAILAILAFSTAALGAAKPPTGYITPSSSSADRCTPSTTTLTTTKKKIKTFTLTPTCPTCATTKCPTGPTKCPTGPTKCPTGPTKCPTAPVTSTVTSTTTETLNQTITSTTTQVFPNTVTTSVTTTATPGPVVELTAYHQRSCGVSTVRDGNQPDFQQSQLILNAATGSSQCQKITQTNPQSFSWDIVSFAGSPPASCHLYFYFGDSCFDDNGGSQQISLNNGANTCHNVAKNVRSVRLFC